MKSFVRKAPVMAECEGRQFVSTNDFLKCYPEASTYSKKELRNEWKGQCVVEKVNYEILFRMMKDICWDVNGEANCSPIVLKDGWVFWLPGSHFWIVDYLGQVLFGANEPAHSNAADGHKILSSGAGWYVSTARSKTIRCGKLYKPTLGEKIIFSTFRRDDIC